MDLELAFILDSDGSQGISALVAFVPPSGGHHREGRHYNDALLAGEDGQVEHLGHRFTS
jgi:hypothetical protein